VHRAASAVRSFLIKAYRENITGLSGMVAYNLLLSLLPLALLGLFIASRVLQSSDLEQSIFTDLRHIFPSAGEHTITNALHRVERSSAGLGVFALVTSIWFGSSFWGALDTAFCSIYHFRCRTWLQQKRFALVMLVVVLLFMVATVIVPALQSVLVEGAQDLPFGLGDFGPLVYAITLSAGLAILFAVLCVIFWTVPNERVPWRAIWPGALGATLAIAVVDYAFPLYLSNISTLAHIGTTLVFIVIILIWFYALAIIMLGGAVINSLRFEAGR
jgi:membrane protein